MPDEPKSRRLQTATERDVQSALMRKERELAQQRGNGAAFAGEEITGNYTGDELDAMRAGRPPEDRLHILEKKHDNVVERLGKVETSVAGLAGEMKVIPRLIDTMQNATKAMQDREAVKIAAEAEAAKAKAAVEAEAAKAAIEVNKAKELNAAAIDKDEKRDAIKARASKRKRNLYFLGAGVAALSVLKHVYEIGEQVFHWLGSHL